MVSEPVLAGRYALRVRLGKGGMGVVWAASDLLLRRDVAVKTVDLDATDDPATRERFAREAMATASLSHPNIVTVFDAGIDGATAYLVMELLPGPTLASMVAQGGALPVERATTYAGQTAAALSASHALGLIHRDIKPSNLMLDGLGRLKVVDFGIARLMQSNAARLTTTATAVGSAPYMSPEQARGEDASTATDVYALGCVLMTLLTGQPPFTGEHPMGLLQDHLHSPPPRVRSRRVDAPPALDALVDEMLAKEPASRPRVDQVQVRLDGVVRSYGAEAAVPMPQTRPLDTEAGHAAYISPSHGDPTRIVTASELDGQPEGTWRQGRVRVLALAALAAVAGLVWAITALSGDPTSGGNKGKSTGEPSSSSPASPASSDSESSGPSVSNSTPPASGSELSDAVAALSSAVESMPPSDEHNNHAQDELLRGLDKIEKALDKGDAKDLAHQVDGFSNTLEHLVDKQEIDSTAEQEITVALADLMQLLPAA